MKRKKDGLNFGALGSGRSNPTKLGAQADLEMKIGRDQPLHFSIFDHTDERTIKHIAYYCLNDTRVQTSHLYPAYQDHTVFDSDYNQIKNKETMKEWVLRKRLFILRTGQAPNMSLDMHALQDMPGEPIQPVYVQSPSGLLKEWHITV